MHKSRGPQTISRGGKTRQRRVKGFSFPVVPLLAVLVALFALSPFIYLLSSGFSVTAITDLLSYPHTWQIIARTIGLTFAIMVISLALGVGAAFVVARTDIPFHGAMTVLLAMPLAIPGFVSAYAIYTGNLLVAPMYSFVSTFWGASIVISLTLYPYIFLACLIGLHRLDPSQEEVARSLGRSQWSIFWSVTFPQLRPAMASSLLIVGLHALSEYGAVAQLGQDTLTTTIVAEMTDYGHYDQARSLALLLVLIAAVLLAIGLWFNGKSQPLSVGMQTVRPPRRLELGAWKYPTFAGLIVVVLAAVGPTVFMTIRGLMLGASRSGSNWTQVLRAASNSLSYGVAAGLVATVVAFPVTWWVFRKPSVASRLTERTVWLAHSIPSAVIALALVFIGAQLIPSLYKTPVLLVASYVILYMPLAVTNQGVGLQAASPKFDDVAASLGAGFFRRFFKISLPLAMSGVMTGALLVGLDAAKELTSTLMLLPFNTDTLATGLWATTNGESLDFAAAAPYSLMLVVLGVFPVWLISRRTLRQIEPSGKSV